MHIENENLFEPLIYFVDSIKVQDVSNCIKSEIYII